MHVDSDEQIAKALLRPGSESRRALLAKGQLVGIKYRQMYAENAAERAQSPFEQKDQLSVTDPAAFKVKAHRDHLEISVNAPAAAFVEEGTTGAQTEKYMKLQLKDGTVIKKKAKRKRGRKGGPKSFIVKEDSKLYLLTKRVKPVKGRYLLERAVKAIFR